MAPLTYIPPARLQWLFFDLNSFFASVEQQENPTLIGKPIAVIPNPTDATSAIAASYEAKAYGIKTGTKIYDAKRLCPDLICVLAQHDKYVEYHHRIWQEVERHIPIEQTCSIDEAACRLMTNEQDPKHAAGIARRIKQGLRSAIGPAITCSIGIAQNKFLAKTASDMHKPDGLTILMPNDYTEQLFRLELSDLYGIGQNIERRLKRAGICTVKQLWHAQPKHVRQIWGSVQGEIFWYRLHGHDIPDKDTTKRMVGHSRVLDPTSRDSDSAYHVAQQLTTKACARLRRYGLYARKFSLSVRLSDTPRYRRLGWADETSFAATHDTMPILAQLQPMWQAMQHDTRKARLLKVSIVLHDLIEPEQTTLDLFAHAQPQTTARDQKLSHAVDSLNRRYGAHTVSFGLVPKTNAGYLGTKIAFSRVPSLDEFNE